MRHALTHLLVLALALPASAQPAPEALREVERRAAALRDAPAAEHAAAMDALIAARERLLAGSAGDWRRATWLLDQADALLTHAGRDGAELSAFFGIPAAEQRTRLGDAAAEALRLVVQAEADAAAAVERLESDLFAARADAARAERVAAEIEPRLRVLIDAEQEWRAPLIAARAELLQLALTDAGAAVRRARAAELSQVLSRLNAPDDAGERARRLLLGTAELLAGRPTPAGAVFAQSDMHEGAPQTSDYQRLGMLASAPTLQAARDLARELVAVNDGALGLALVRAEVVARAILTRAPDAPSREAVQRDALIPLAGVVTRTLALRDEVPPPTRASVLEKACLATDGAAALGGRLEPAALLPALRFARAERAMRLAQGDSDAQRQMRSLADDPDADEIVRESALWALARRQEPPSFESARLLVRLAKEFPNSPRVTPALERAEAILRPLMARAEPEPLLLQRETLELLLASEPETPRADQFRSIRLANLALDPRAFLDAHQAELLVRTLPAWGEAHAPQAEADRVNARVVLERALGHAPSPAAREQLARTAREWAARRAPALTPRYDLALADALLALNRPGESLAALDRIADVAVLSPVERARARLVRGRAERAAGSAETAFATLRALADELDREPGADEPRDANGVRPEMFWAAWAEMLEILVAEGATPERAGAARLHLNRLRLLDRQLGGETYRVRIQRVEQSLK